MTTSYPAISVPAGWTDITTLQAGIASAVGVTVQNIGLGVVRAFFGGADAPTGALDGHPLPRFAGFYDELGSAHIWVHGPGHVMTSKK